MASTTTTTTVESKQSMPDTEEHKTMSTEPMSERACDIKKALQTKHEVMAVLLKPNGESEEIKYDASSTAANSLLNGRPTIMGELDEVQIVMARALNQSSCGEPNTHTLPAPFGSLHFNGNYLLFRVDAEGSTIDLTLKEYTDYAETHKAEPAKAADLVDSMFIKSQRTPNTANSRLTLLCIRSQMDKKVRTTNPEADETEIAALIDVELQKLVDGLVFKAGASPLTDPDYKPEDEGKDSDVALDSSEELSMGASQTQGDSTGVQATATMGGASSEGDWRSQLNDALTLVRERGRFDGMKLAEKISSTLYEVNGVDPSLADLADVFRKIQTEFAYEAEDELNDDADSSDNGTAFYLRNKGTKGGEELRGADLVEYATRIVGEDLLSRARSAIAIGKGRGYEPTESELRETVLGFATKMAEGFQLDADANDADANGDGHTDEDPDYNPNNQKDRQYAAEDAVDDMDQTAPLQMSKSATTRSHRGGRSETYSVYFGEARTGKKSVTEIVAAFVGAHGRRPNALEKERLRNFVAMQAAPETIELATKEAMGSRRMRSKTSRKSTTSSPSKVLVTPIKEKKASKAKGFSVYFEKQNPMAEEMAVKWFHRFNHRTPTDLELHGIRSFTKADNDTFKELVFDVEADTDNVNDDVDSKQATIDLDADQQRDADEEASEEVSVSSLVTKATSTAYNLDFEGGDEQMAIKWFERFNQRKPDVAEMKKISKFVEEDHVEQETIDVD